MNAVRRLAERSFRAQGRIHLFYFTLFFCYAHDIHNYEISFAPLPPLPDSVFQIDVMVLYTTKAMIETNDVDGPMRSEAQMETDIITAYEGANNALRDSSVDITLNVVHMERVSAAPASPSTPSTRFLTLNVNYLYT